MTPIRKRTQLYILRHAIVVVLSLLTSTVILPINALSQGLSPDFTTTPVNKRVAEFTDTTDARRPVNAFVAFIHLIINGKNSRLAPASSARLAMFLPGPTAQDAAVPEPKRQKYLERMVFECVTYRDTVACVVSQYADSLCSLWFFSYESGRWVNAGEDLANGLTASRTAFATKAPTFLDYARRIGMLSRIPPDVTVFANSLRTHGKEPKRFLLDALARHRLVVYGELHRRRWSWDLCRSVINDPSFAVSTGTVFMEISAHTQQRLDAFFAKHDADDGLLLDVFREIQIDGWPDRGMFEFLLALRNLNAKLPAERRIKVVAVDIPRPFASFTTAEEKKRFFEPSPDRNAFMANTIEAALKADTGSRGALFIVGAGHAFKSASQGFAATTTPATSGQSAGRLLSDRFPKGEVFTVFSHCPIVDNSGRMPGRLRSGIFDRAFHALDDGPIAFATKSTPFGNEPFDALPEIGFVTSTGTYADNFDGYVFLGPLDDEPADYLLYDLYSDAFVRELQRRAALENTTVQKWFGVEDASRVSIIAKLKASHEGRKKWNGLPPL